MPSGTTRTLLLAALALLAAVPALLAQGSAGDSAEGSRAAPGPRISDDRIPFGAERKRQMAGYSKRHYGRHTWRLERPKAVVLHWTAGSSWQGAQQTFAANQPNRGERPGVCAHYIIGKNGGIHLIVPERIRCRHTIGLNWTAIGIEFVQEAKGSARATDRAILERRRQLRAGLKLVRDIRRRHEIKVRDVVGHSQANDSRLFKDRSGWRNDHSDWQPRSVREFRGMLRRG